MTEYDYELREDEIGDLELAEVVWGDFCDWCDERTVLLWYKASTWAQEIQTLWSWQVDKYRDQLFGLRDRHGI